MHTAEVKPDYFLADIAARCPHTSKGARAGTCYSAKGVLKWMPLIFGEDYESLLMKGSKTQGQKVSYEVGELLLSYYTSVICDGNSLDLFVDHYAEQIAQAKQMVRRYTRSAAPSADGGYSPGTGKTSEQEGLALAARLGQIVEEAAQPIVQLEVASDRFTDQASDRIVQIVNKDRIAGEIARKTSEKLAALDASPDDNITVADVFGEPIDCFRLPDFVGSPARLLAAGETTVRTA